MSSGTREKGSPRPPSTSSAGYRVGYKHPPLEHQFKKGCPSPNPKGRRKRNEQIDLSALLGEPIKVTLDGESKQIDPFEAELRSLVKRGKSGNMAAAKEFLRHCERSGLFEIPEDEDDHQWVLYIPKDWDSNKWHEIYDRLGAPPWPGDRDGLIPPERWAEIHARQWRKRG